MTDQPVGNPWLATATEIARSESVRRQFGKLHIKWGYKAFVSGVSHFDTFFPYDQNDRTEESKKAALAAYKKFCAENGVEHKLIQTTLNLWIPVSELIGVDTSKWNTDAVWYTFVAYDASLKEILIPSFAKHGINGPQELWVQLRFADDKGGYQVSFKERNEDGEEVTKTRTKQIPYIEATYKTREECEAAWNEIYGSDDSQPTSTAKPKLSEEEDMAKVHQEDASLSLFSIGQIFGKDCKTVAAACGVDKAFVMADIVKAKEAGATIDEAKAFYKPYGIPDAVIAAKFK